MEFPPNLASYYHITFFKKVESVLFNTVKHFWHIQFPSRYPFVEFQVRHQVIGFVEMVAHIYTEGSSTRYRDNNPILIG